MEMSHNLKGLVILHQFIEKAKQINKQNLHMRAWASSLRSASALALRTSSEVETNFGNTQDCISGNCSASNSARGETTFTIETYTFQNQHYSQTSETRSFANQNVEKQASSLWIPCQEEQKQLYHEPLWSSRWFGPPIGESPMAKD